MAEARESWEQVGDRLSELGLKLKLHVEQAGNAGRTEAEDKIRDALHAAGDAIDQAFSALGNVVRDEAVREDARDVGQSVADALYTSFTALGERFRSALNRPGA